jgi:hypothetical protein
MNQQHGYYEDDEGNVQPLTAFPSLIEAWTEMITRPHLPQGTELVHQLRYGTLDQSIGSVKEDVEKLFARLKELGNEWVGEDRGRNLSQFLYKRFEFNNYLQIGSVAANEDWLFQHDISRQFESWVKEAAGRRDGAWQKVVGFGGEYLVRSNSTQKLIPKVFLILRAFLPGYFDKTNWTSSLRRHAFPELGTPNDKDAISDFVFKDENGIFGPLLGLGANGPKTYHLEVKTTREADQVFLCSGRQFTKVLFQFSRS